MKVDSVIFAEQLQILSESGKPAIITPFPGFVILSHHPSPQRREFLSFCIIVTFVGSSSEHEDGFNGSIVCVDPVGDVILASPFKSGKGKTMGTIIPNNEDLTASIANLDMRNFSFTHPGDYSFIISFPGGEHICNLRALVATPEEDRSI